MVGAVTIVSGIVPRVVETFRGGRAPRQARQRHTSMNRKMTPRHQHTHTPADPDTHTDTPHVPQNSWFQIFTFEINSSKLKFLTRRGKRHGLRKNQLRVETNRRNKCSTTNKELHNLIRGTPADIRRQQRACMHLELLDHCPTWRRSRERAFVRTSGPIASRDEGAFFLTATKTYKGSVRRGLRVPPQNAGHDLIPTPDFGGMNRRKECVPCSLP